MSTLVGAAARTSRDGAVGGFVHVAPIRLRAHEVVGEGAVWRHVDGLTPDRVVVRAQANRVADIVATERGGAAYMVSASL